MWAPDAKTVSVQLGNDTVVPLERRDGGWHEAVATKVSAGATYRFRIDDEIDVPDPASRFNPHGVHGPSEVIDPGAFDWDATHWRGRPWHEAVLYELHVGTFTPQGTFAAAIPRLAELAELGITCLEVMPVATFAGNRGWGYDGVLPFAPHPAYGRPEDLKRFVQAAHAQGISVVLDVVYNHFGPDGNFLYRYASEFFTERHHTPWGAAINFEAAAGQRVREFFIQNALYWLDEYQFDGLRLDAIHAIKDDSRPDFVDELAQTLEQGPARERHIHLILENHFNEARRLQPGAQSLLSRAQWNDDSHHALHVLATDETDGYYVDYADPVRLTGRLLAEGFAYQGEPSVFGGDHPRGEASGWLPPTAFINFLQNHDQIGNRALGERLAHLTDPQRLRAVTAILLLSPQPPLLFMGEEYAAPQPFLYFCDFAGELATAVTDGRRNEFAKFRAFADERTRASIPDPNAETTFQRSCLQWEQRTQGEHAQWLTLTRELLALRSTYVVPLIPLIVAGEVRYAVEDDLLTVRWPLSDGRCLALRANFSSHTLVAPWFGTLLYATDDRKTVDAAAALRPWDVHWWLIRNE